MIRTIASNYWPVAEILEQEPKTPGVWSPSFCLGPGMRFSGPGPAEKE